MHKCYKFGTFIITKNTRVCKLRLRKPKISPKNFDSENLKLPPQISTQKTPNFPQNSELTSCTKEGEHRHPEDEEHKEKDEGPGRLQKEERHVADDEAGLSQED